MIIRKQDTDGTKPLLDIGEFGYDNYPAGGDSGRVYVGDGSNNIAIGTKEEIVNVDTKINTHIADVDNPHSVTKTQVGLSNVDNTADINKPISTATQAALDSKQDNLVSGINIKTIEGQSLVGSGNIDLNKSDVGLANVDNTADIDKPISTAVQTALDLKADINSPALTGVPSAPTAAVGNNTAQIATTAFVNSEIANDTYSKTQLDTGQLDNRYYTETETNLLLDAKVDDTEIASVNLLRADKYLAAQNIANMLYTDGNLTKIQYNNATDVDYEVFGYVSGNLSTIQHYVGSVLKGTTTLSYTGGNLVSAIFVGV